MRVNPFDLALGVVVGLALLWPAFKTGRLLLWAVRFGWGSGELRRSMLQAVWIRLRWRRLATMLRLSVLDPTPTLGRRLVMGARGRDNGPPPRPRMHLPRIRIRADQYGVRVTALTLPRVGLPEWQTAGDDLANAWGCVRVSVTSGGPGRIEVRGVRRDPLVERYQYVPDPGTILELASWSMGRDEYAGEVTIGLSDVPGVAIAGLPGRGKTSLLNGLIVQKATHPAVQFVVLDGKVSELHEGDYGDLLPRIARGVGDDLKKANALLRELVELRRARSSSIRESLGVRNWWNAHPVSPAWPLVVTIIDEAHTYFVEYRGSDPESKKLGALTADNRRLVEDLIKKGRSVGMLTIVATQKATGDAIPTNIRDVCPVSLSFAQRTDDAAVAALGADIRDYPEANPVRLQGPEYVGVAAMAVDSRPGYTRVRTPYVSDQDAAAMAEVTAHLRRDPFVLVVELKPDLRVVGEEVAEAI